MNEELIKKADMVLANLASNGGLLNPEQANTFYRNLIDQPTILSVARTVPMNSPQMEINKIGFGSRILRAGVENTRLSSSDRSKPDLGKVNLQTKEVIAEILLPYAVLEDNIERGNMENTILALIAQRASLDLEELVIQADTASPDDYLALFDGLIKRITTHTVDAATTNIQPITFSNALKALPSRFKRNKNALRFFTTFDVEQDYANSISNRQTALGDAVVQGGVTGATGGNIRVHGVQMVPCSMIPDDTGVLIDPNNIIIGIQRNFRIESERLISERQIKIVLTARVAFNLEEEPASVLIDNLALPA